MHSSSSGYAWAEGARLTRNGAVVPGFAERAATGFRVLALNADAADYAAVNHRHLRGLRVRAVPSPAYRLALAAAGEVDLGVSLIDGLAAWDIAGGHALLIGAGGVMLQRDGAAVNYRYAGFSGVIGGADPQVRAALPMLASLPTNGTRVQRMPAKPARPEPDAAWLARAQGCLLGLFSGDALGSAVEFRTSADIARNFPDGVTILQDGGTWNLIAGQPTDDGEMAQALARSLVAESGFQAAAVGAAYVDWRGSGPFDIGTTTSQGIAAIRAGRAATSDSQANGALMRVAPIGVMAAGDPSLAARLAAEDARLTHPAPVCQAASAAFAAAIAVAIEGADREQIWAAAHDHAGDGPGAPAVRDRLAAARHAAPGDFQYQMGWVLTAFQNAFFRLMSGQALGEAVGATVGCGGDTDTNAAVCGALLGSAQGRDAVPLQWRNAVLTCRPVRATGVTHPRPAVYWPDDALCLAEALLAVGPNPAARRPKKDLDVFVPFGISGKPIDPGNIGPGPRQQPTPQTGSPKKESAMSDFERLNDQQKALLQIKLDGHVEACILAAHQLNIGVEEAISLTSLAFLREFCSRQFDRMATEAILAKAVNQTYHFGSTTGSSYLEL